MGLMRDKRTHLFAGWVVGIAALWLGAMKMISAQNAFSDAPRGPVHIEPTAQGGFLCKTEEYQAEVGKDGGLLSLRAGGAEFLSPVGGAGPAAGFVHGGQFVILKTVRQTAPDTLVAEGEPKDPAKSVPASSCPFTARVMYHFKPDSIELTLEQSLEQYGG